MDGFLLTAGGRESPHAYVFPLERLLSKAMLPLSGLPECMLEFVCCSPPISLPTLQT